MQETLFDATITKSDGTRILYDLKSASKLGDVSPTKRVVLFFDNGEVFQGYTDGSVDEDFEFCLKASKDDKFSAALPLNRLMGWAYEDDGCHKHSLWYRLRTYWSKYWWFWIFWCLLLISSVFRGI
ncbi:MAG: hypothetical protein J5980_01605 [Muribaculaceae bacterium]|nr:hypothetical protein [Muribaculaceae bacterium]MBO6250313.1 hypothetical protein [Muribaculaceae bacterium]